MRLPSSWARGLAQVGLVAGLLFRGSSNARAEDPPPPAASDVAVPCQPGGMTGLPDMLSSGPVQPPAEKSFWENVPPITKTPRAGNFFVLPTGPGYYSLWDVFTDTYVQKPPNFPWPPFSPFQDSLFNADFRYLDKPGNTQEDWLDPIKRMHLGDDWLLSIGGEERFQYKHEFDSRLTGKENEYGLLRSRLYTDLWYRDLFRVYVEYIDAQSSRQDLAPLPIDVNHSDLLNLFGEVKLAELADHPLYLRGGRQELLYGSQRLISPLDWANTRRTFEGVKAYWHGDDFDVDAFWTRPVVINPTHFDSENDKQSFAGLWTTYRPMKGQAIDLYYLYFDSAVPVVATPAPGKRGGQDLNTFGSRYSGECEFLLWDFEGMYQFGEHDGQAISAGAATTGLGVHFAELPLNPTFWIYNDFASGDHKPGVGEFGTFNQLFPFGHYYFGFIDVVGRQNIDDLNLHCYIFPTNWIATGLQYHMFRLDSAKDALYNAAGVAIRRDPTGKAGTDVGSELDFTTNFHVNMHNDILVGYSHLYAGEFIKRTGAPSSPDYFYLQYSYRW